MTEGLTQIPLSQLCESPLNPRSIFNAAKQEALNKSVAELGVLSPITVRPLAPNRFEIIVGHRRKRAAEEAGLKEIPAVVRNMADAAVIAAQLAENDKREDLHPLEVAEGYRRLRELGQSAEEIAAAVDTSPRDVWATLQLLQLGEKARKAFLAGDLNKSTALLVARIPVEKLQLEALKELTEGHLRHASVRDATEAIRSRFMLKLDEASFDRADAELVPAAGSCAACPHRTGNSPDLFGDVGKDLCTKPPCYEEKSEAAWKRTVEERKAKGLSTLSAAETKATFDQWGGINRDAGYVKASETCSDDPKLRPYKALLGKSARGLITLARAPNGETVELLPRSGLRGHLREAGHDFWKDDGKPNGTKKKGPTFRETNEAAERERRVQRAVIAELVAKVEATAFDKKLLALLVDQLCAEGIDDEVLERRFPNAAGDPMRELDKWLEKAGEAQLRGLLFEALFGGTWVDAGALKKACEHLKVDQKEVRAKVKEAEKLEAKAKEQAEAEALFKKNVERGIDQALAKEQPAPPAKKRRMAIVDVEASR